MKDVESSTVTDGGRKTTDEEHKATSGHRSPVTSHHISGIIVILLGLLFLWLSIRSSQTEAIITAGLIIVGGLAILLLKRSYATQIIQALKHSVIITPRKKLLALVFDALFIGLCTLVLFALTMLVEYKSAELNAVFGDAASALAQGALQQNIALVQSFFITIGIGVFATLITIIFIHATLAGLSWSTLAEVRFTGALFKRYLGFSVLWLGSFTIIAIGILSSVKDTAIPLIFIAVLLLFLHFIHVANYYLVRNTFRKAMALTFSKGIQLHRFAVPYTFALVLAVIITNITAPLQVIAPSIALVTLALLFMLYSSWFKVFLSEILTRLDTPQTGKKQ